MATGDGIMSCLLQIMSAPDSLRTLQLVAGLLGHERTAFLARLFPYPALVPGALVWQDVLIGIYNAHGQDFDKVHSAIHHVQTHGLDHIAKAGKAKGAKGGKAKGGKAKGGKAKDGKASVRHAPDKSPRSPARNAAKRRGSRKSPARPARTSRGMTMRGLDGNMWHSVPDRNGRYSWRKSGPKDRT